MESTSSSPEASSPQTDLRSGIGEALTGKFTQDQIKILIDEILAIKKQVAVDLQCKKCGQKQRVYGEASDAKAVSAALKDLMNESWGRPQEVQAEPEFRVVRKVYVVSNNDPVSGGLES